MRVARSIRTVPTPNPSAIMNLTLPRSSAWTQRPSRSIRASCLPIMPWDYLRVNSIFQVIHGAGMRTAWSDKHAIYTSFNGPVGWHQHRRFLRPGDRLAGGRAQWRAVPQDDDWAHVDAATKQYDGYKVQAVINELDGYDHSGTEQGWHSGDPRDELPDRVGRREGRLAGHDHQERGRHVHGGVDRARRLPPGHDDSGPVAGRRVGLRQHAAASGWSTRSIGTAASPRLRSSSRPSTVSRRRIRCC